MSRECEYPAFSSSYPRSAVGGVGFDCACELQRAVSKHGGWAGNRDCTPFRARRCGCGWQRSATVSLSTRFILFPGLLFQAGRGNVFAGELLAGAGEFGPVPLRW